MLRRVSIVALAGLLATAQLPAATTVELVVDGSSRMWTRLADGRLHISALRDALIALAHALPADGPALGLRVFGGLGPRTDEAECEGSTLLVPVGALDRSALIEAVTGLEAGGGAGLIGALLDAATDLEGRDGERLIILVTAGEEGCHRSPAAVAEALTEGSIELRVVGIALSKKTLADFGAHAPSKNARTTAELAGALAWALEGHVPRLDASTLLRLELSANEAAVVDAEVALVDELTDAMVAAEARDGGFEAELPPRLYGLRLAVPEHPPQELTGLALDAGSPGPTRIELGPQTPVELELAPADPVAGDRVVVWWSDAPPGRASITVAPVGTPLASFAVRAQVDAPSGSLELDLPDQPTTLEARYFLESGDGLDRLLARHPFATRAPEAALEAPDEVEVSTAFEVACSGPGHPLDHLAVIPHGKPASERVACLLFDGDESPSLVAPAEPGEYDLCYLSGLSGRTLARTTITVFKPEAKLFAPTEVLEGARFEVGWEGPGGATDVVVVAPAEAGADEYLGWSFTTAGNPLELEAPGEPGPYELRYVDGAGRRVLATVPLEVEAVPVSLSAPEVARAGGRLTVSWSGPDRAGDFVSLARPGWPARRYLDWAFTSTGSPLSLAAPDNPGAYELRYVDGASLEVRARAPLEVR